MARVYLESSVISYRVARPSRNPITFARQQSAHQWWEQELPKHNAAVSRLVVTEISRGNLVEAGKRLELIREIVRLEATDEAADLAEQIVASGALPQLAADDALHYAIAVVHRMEFLLTWNCKHLANGFIRRKMGMVCRMAGYEPVTICTTDELKEI